LETENVQERTRLVGWAIYKDRATSLLPAAVFMKSRHDKGGHDPAGPAVLVCTFFAGRPGNFETVGS
jgi:hypothetical protein